MSYDNETNNPQGWNPTPGSPADTDRVGFCQDCGKPLTAGTIRNVGAGVFCEPCLATRVAAVPPAYSVPPAVEPTVAGMSHPGLAALLGFIPGVGAMYNGQFAKGVIHLIIFAVLVSLTDNVNGIFGLFVFGWVCYQAFEAYHTAKARQEGLPLPNAFGFNDIGERMGFGKGWGNTNPTWTRTSPAPSTPYAPTSTAAAPDWVGYVPPTAFAAAAPPPSGTPDPSASANTTWAQPGYASTYASTYTGTTPAVPMPVVLPPARRFPMAAVWLIGLGVLILLGNLAPEWRISAHWLLPLLLAGVSIATFVRRMSLGGNLFCMLRGPVILMVLAVLFALQAAHVLTLGQSWPVLLVAIGILLLIERTLGVGAGYTVTPAYASSVPTAAYTAPPTATTTADPNTTARAVWAEDNTQPHDATKGGL